MKGRALKLVASRNFHVHQFAVKIFGRYPSECDRQYRRRIHACLEKARDATFHRERFASARARDYAYSSI
jgi:hypothetical protein